MRVITDDQRRARLAQRHAIAPQHRVAGAAEAARAMTCLHSTEPPTVYLAAHARAEVSRGDVARALYEDRSLVKQLAMRRTLFAFPRSLLPAVWGSAAARTAALQRAQLVKDVERYGVSDDGVGWTQDNLEAVLALLRARGPMTTMQLRAEIPALDARMTIAPDKPYGATVAIAPRVLTTLAAEGVILRGDNDGSWRSSRPLWTATEAWLGEASAAISPEEGYAALVRSWLHTFGPGTEDDIVWWLGATKTAVRKALADVDAVPVELSGGTGWLLLEDLEDVPTPEPWVALLPVLDPTTMGWKERDFYLGGHRPRIFDSNGNAGATVWADGRIIGGWHQTPDARVVLALLEEVSRGQAKALERERRRVEEWLDGEVVTSVYLSPLSRERLRT